MKTVKPHRPVALLAALAAALFVSACADPAPDHDAGDHEQGTETAIVGQPADFNDADVAFVTGMIPHHQQAVELSNMVPAHTDDPEMLKLAETIAGAQGPEIETMKVFLVQWRAGESDDGAGHEGHDMSGMPGMADAATMERLQTLDGEEFDRLWLQSMIAHHEGAVAMANTEIEDGANVDAKRLAEQIAIAQQAEITSMRQMLGE